MQYFSLVTTLTLTLLSTFVTAQTPAGFTPASSVRLGLNFGSVVITPGLQIGIDVPALAPTISATVPLSGTYILVLVDPDAPTPSNPTSAQLLHWLQPSLTFPTLNTTSGFYPAAQPLPAAIVPYVRPSPANTSPAHRYIALLFAQPANFTVPAAFQGYSATNRTLFNVTNFATQARLGAPVEANYFLVANTTANATTTTTTTRATTTGTVTATVIAGTTSTIRVNTTSTTTVIGTITTTSRASTTNATVTSTSRATGNTTVIGTASSTNRVSTTTTGTSTGPVIPKFTGGAAERGVGMLAVMTIGAIGWAVLGL